MTKTQEISLDELWNSASIADQVFYSELLTNLPAPARRYLESATPCGYLEEHALGTPLASAVRLWMHGEIKLKEKLHPFKGEEVICWNRGMIWRANTWMQGLGYFWQRDYRLG